MNSLVPGVIFKITDGSTAVEGCLCPINRPFPARPPMCTGTGLFDMKCTTFVDTIMSICTGAFAHTETSEKFPRGAAAPLPGRHFTVRSWLDGSPCIVYPRAWFFGRPEQVKTVKKVRCEKCTRFFRILEGINENRQCLPMRSALSYRLCYHYSNMWDNVWETGARNAGTTRKLYSEKTNAFRILGRKGTNWLLICSLPRIKLFSRLDRMRYFILEYPGLYILEPHPGRTSFPGLRTQPYHSLRKHKSCVFCALGWTSKCDL